MSKADDFKTLHQQDNLLHIGNVWDLQSALAFEKMGYQAVGTSSAAIADMLGYDDGEQMSFDELLSVVESIQSRISIPLTVDIEGGYSRDIDDIVRHIDQLHTVGVAGINLEDSFVDETKQRQIIDASDFGNTIASIKSRLTKHNIDIFLNIRTDPFLMGLDNPLEQALERAEIYQAAGADGLFVPCITNENDIKRLVESVSIPVNVMAMPTLPSFLTLKELGVKRVSSGSFIYERTKKIFNETLENIEKGQSFDLLFK